MNPDFSSSFGDDLFLSDAAYAEEFHLQQLLEAILASPPSPPRAPLPRPSPPRHRHPPPPSSSGIGKISCGICLEDQEQESMFRIQGCFHSFCSVCISLHIQTKLNDNTIQILCPSYKCLTRLDPSLFKSIIPSEVVTRWEAVIIESAFLESEKYFCPYQDCSEMLLNDSEGGVAPIREATCPRCRRLFCAQCRVPWHSGFQCGEFKSMAEEEREEHMTRSLAKEKKWKECPKCKSLVEKTGGCIHVTCRCKMEFCYICGSRWDNSHWMSCQEMAVLPRHRRSMYNLGILDV